VSAAHGTCTRTNPTAAATAAAVQAEMVPDNPIYRDRRPSRRPTARKNAIGGWPRASEALSRSDSCADPPFPDRASPRPPKPAALRPGGCAVVRDSHESGRPASTLTRMVLGFIDLEKGTKGRRKWR